jgi:MFS family permease
MLTMGAVAFLPVNAFSIPYARSVNMDMAFYGKCLSLTFLISLCLSYFLGWLADIFHPIRMSMVALVGYLFVTAWGWTYATNADSFAIAFVAHAVVSGVYVTSVASLGQRLYPHSRYAQFASAGGILMSICTMGISPIMGIVIDSSGAAYQYTFLAGGMIALLALMASFYAYGRFVKLGGVKSYVAPES